PSAGITIATALASLMTGGPVRGGVAMTGEITLRGEVLPIGGLKEKGVAGYRYGATTVVIARENERDLSEIPDDIRKLLTFHLVDNMDEVLELALASPHPGAGLGDGASPEGAGRSESEGPVTH